LTTSVYAALVLPVFAASAAVAAVPAAPPSTAVRGVTVTAVRPKEQVLLDRKVYSVASDLQAVSGTAADILTQIPSVSVDADGGVSLRGDTAVTILVDGKPSAQFSGAAAGASLQQFPAQDIDRIEVMTNPPAQYRSEGSAGVINIITRKSRKLGLSGAANASVGDSGRYVVGVNGAWNAGRLKISGGASLRRDIKDRMVADARAAVFPGGGLALSREVLDEHLRRLIPQAKLGVDYTFNDRQSLSLNLNHRELKGVRTFDQHNETGPVGGPPAASTDRHSDGREYSIDEGEALRFDQKLWRPGETLSLSLQRSVTREREGYAYRNLNIAPPGPATYDDLHLSLDLIKTEASADYVLPLAGERSLKLGYDFEDDANRFDNRGDTRDAATGMLRDNANITSHFRFHQQIHTGYGEFETPLVGWTLQTGLRLEQTNVQTLLIAGNPTSDYGYFRAYPSLNMERRLGNDAKVSLSLSRRMDRPDPEALNPFVDYQDIHNLRSGNSALLPQDTWSYEAAYNSRLSKIDYRLTAYYRFNRNSVTDVTRVIAADVVLATKANLPKSKAAGLEFTASGRIVHTLAYNVSGNLFYGQIDAAALGLAGLRSTLGVNLKASLDWKPDAVDTAQLSFSRTDRRLTPQGSVAAINIINLGWRRQLSPSLAAILTLSDALDGQIQRRQIDTIALTDVYERHQLGRVVYGGLVYTFGANRKPKPGTFDYEAN
jgi:outer membrane receptor for ferrienterochelin and colicin